MFAVGKIHAFMHCTKSLSRATEYRYYYSYTRCYVSSRNTKNIQLVAAPLHTTTNTGSVFRKLRRGKNNGIKEKFSDNYSAVSYSICRHFVQDKICNCRVHELK